jgi:Fur family ferric uptake transcriptional regulator
LTVAPERRSLRFESLDDVVEALRGAGHRVTLATRSVLEALFAVDGPVSAEQIVATVRPRVELPTVYRNLERLEQLGAVRHMHAGHGPGLYTLAGAGEREYLVCERCGSCTAVDPGDLDDLRAGLEERFGFSARFTHFPVSGLCARCSRR